MDQKVGMSSYLSAYIYPGTVVLKYSVPYRNRTRSGGQSIAGHESDVVGSNSYIIKLL